MREPQLGNGNLEVSGMGSAAMSFSYGPPAAKQEASKIGCKGLGTPKAWSK
jgi:hypothetical protein